jgi:hypothetical protein
MLPNRVNRTTTIGSFYVPPRQITGPSRFRLIVTPLSSGAPEGVDSSKIDPVFGIPRQEIERMLAEEATEDRALFEAVFGAQLATIRDDDDDQAR